MEAESQRIDELRRRVQLDPASIAFAHLADEHRRAGDHEEAVRVCRAGLEHHPAYLLAHVTLGRALMELAQYTEARIEFEYVLRVAPDNLIALKGMEELQQKEGPAPPVTAAVKAPLKLRPSTENASPGKPLNAAPPEVANTSAPQARVASPPEAAVASPPQAPVPPAPAAPVARPPEAVSAPPLEVASTSAPEPKVASPPGAPLASPPLSTVDPELAELEGWLAALQAARVDRG